MSKKGEPIRAIRLSATEILGMYLCCCFTCCKINPLKNTAKIDKLENKSKLQFKSNIMMKLEKDKFSLDKSLDSNFTKNTNDSTKNYLLGKGKCKTGYLGDQDIENHFYEGQHYEDKIAKRTIEEGHDKYDRSVSSSFDEESLRSHLYNELRDGKFYSFISFSFGYYFN